MSYIDKTLVPGEKVVYTTKLHWIVMVGHLFTCLVLLAGAGYLGYYLYYNRANLQLSTLHIIETGLAVLLFLALLTLIMGSIRRNATEMAVTTRRVVVKTGLASRRTIEMLLNKVETIEVSEPTMGRMLGYGSITIIGTGGTSEPFHKIAHPLEFRNYVQQEIERLTPGDTATRAVSPKTLSS
jgi:uncharacterized membrane protein YdbT with pleckstrin-like domain